MKKLSVVLVSILLVLTLTATAFAANFVPSIERRPLDPVLNGEGFGILHEGDNSEVLPMGTIFLVGLEGATYPSRKGLDDESLEILAQSDKAVADAYAEIKGADKLSDLFSDKRIAKNKKLVVSDLFDVTSVGEKAKDVKETFDNNGQLEITLRLNIQKGQEFYISQKSGGQWTTLRDNQVVRNADGTVTVFLEQLGTLAVLQAAAEGTVLSPQTSDTCVQLSATAAVLFAAAVGFVLLGTRRKAQHEA